MSNSEGVWPVFFCAHSVSSFGANCFVNAFFVILNIFSNSFFHSRGAQVVENLKNFSFAHIFDKNVNENAKKPV